MVRYLLYLVLCLFLIGGMGLGAVEAQILHNHGYHQQAYDQQGQSPQGNDRWNNYKKDHKNRNKRNPLKYSVKDVVGPPVKDRMMANRRRSAELLSLFENGRSGNNKVFVPIQFHIVQRNDGSGGETHQDILDNLCKLNEDFDSIGVEFYLFGPIRILNQDLLYEHEIGGSTGSYFMSLYRDPSVINVFVGNRIISATTGGTILGYYNGGLDIIFAIRSSVDRTSTTLTHEMGHFLSLPHTFDGWEDQAYSSAADGDPNTLGIVENAQGRTPSILPTGELVESIPRTGGQENCQVAGDGFCDTEPNYLFGFFGARYNNGCDYAATAMDPNGWLFLPSSIAPEPTRFYFEAGSDKLTEFYLKNDSQKDRLFARTLVVLEAEYTFNGTSVMMWSDTLGNTDTTEVGGEANAERNIVGRSVGQTLPGIINLGGHSFDVTISAPTAPDLTFEAAAPEYSILNNVGAHRVDMDSIRITNPSTAVATVAAGTNIILTDVFSGPNGVIASEDRAPLALPNALAPGESYTFFSPDLRLNNTSEEIAGVNINFSTYAPYRQPTIVNTENVMSYYSDVCTRTFSPEQAQAMRADVAARGFATLYPAPPQIDIVTQATVLHPVDNSIAPQPLVHFAWDPVPGATLYEVSIYQVNPITGARLLGGDTYERMVTGTDLWLDVVPNQTYKWTVFPVNATNFCDRAALQSNDAQFQVFDWGIGVDQVEAPQLTTSIYPNPTREGTRVTLALEAKTTLQARFAMFNSLGQSVMSIQEWDIVPGSNVQQLDISALPAGLYVINIETPEGSQSHKLVIEGK